MAKSSVFTPSEFEDPDLSPQTSSTTPPSLRISSEEFHVSGYQDRNTNTPTSDCQLFHPAQDPYEIALRSAYLDENRLLREMDANRYDSSSGSLNMNVQVEDEPFIVIDLSKFVYRCGPNHQSDSLVISANDGNGSVSSSSQISTTDRTRSPLLDSGRKSSACRDIIDSDDPDEMSEESELMSPGAKPRCKSSRTHRMMSLMHPGSWQFDRMSDKIPKPTTRHRSSRNKWKNYEVVE